jgi:hypothetical protein
LSERADADPRADRTTLVERLGKPKLSGRS